ncbi:MAG TPA: thiamine pyrophosphate-binding protein, partial [Actinomycetota bacterium]
MRTGADAIAETLSAHDVPVVFTLCGDHTNPLLDAIDRAGIRIVDTRDERGAAWMAAGWAYATARTGVVITSNTPALLNAATGLADADACGIPVLCLTGGVAQADRGAGHPGEADQAAIAAPWSRWTGTARSAEEAAGRTARAFAATRERRPGVAVLDLPLDVQHGRADVPVAPPIRPARPGPSPAELETLVDALDRAERPVLLAGSRAWFSGASAGLRSLIERAALPTFTTRAARGLIPDSHEHALGFPSLLGEPAQIAFGEADLALVVGADLDLMVAGGAFHDGCTLVRVDSDPGAFALGRKADVAIEGNEAAVVGEVSARARARAP